MQDATRTSRRRGLARLGAALRLLLALVLVPLVLLPTVAKAEPAGASQPPLLRILSSKLNRDGSLTLEVEVLAPTPGQRVQLLPLIDGQLIHEVVPTSRNIGLTDEYTLTLPVKRRDFVVTLVAVLPDGTESTRVSQPFHDSAVDKRPRLFALTVGIGHYSEAELPQLRYPSKDARDLAEALRTQSDKVYRSVEVRVLTEADASREKLRSGLTWLAENVKEDDTALLFLAGHGTNDPDGTYYFLPSDSRFVPGATGLDMSTLVSGNEIQEALRQIRGRVILMLDTCHSGNVLGKRSLTRLINELITENRIAVLAASTGEQTSQESSEWENGAFTKAVVEGLRGIADYQEDGIIMLSELETWIGLRVKQLTHGSQTAALAKPNAAPDYEVAAVPGRGRKSNPQTVRRRVIWGSVAAGGLLLGVAAATTLGVLVSGAQSQSRNFDLSFKPASSSTSSTAAAIRFQ